MEGRGNGRADRPTEAAAYRDEEFVADAVAVLDTVGVPAAFVCGLSAGGRYALQLAARHPDRVRGVITLSARYPAASWPDFHQPRASYEGWQKANKHYWLADYRGWAEFFFTQVFTEPHSLKQREDGVAWALGTDAETLLLTGRDTAHGNTPADAEAVCRQVRCPVLVVHGDQDAVVPYQAAVALAGWTGAELVTLGGSGHAPTLRDPVRVNLLIRDFVERVAGAAAAADNLDPAAQPAPPRTVRVLADRARPCAPGPGDRRRAAAAAPRPGDRLVDPGPGDPGTGRTRRAGAPGVAAGWPASARTSRPRPASTTCTPSRRCAGWTRSWWRTSTCSTTWWPSRPTTCGRWTRVGRSTSSCSTTPSSSGRPTSGWPTSSGCSRCPTGAPPSRCWPRTSTPSGSSGSGAIPGCVTARSSWATPATW